MLKWSGGERRVEKVHIAKTLCWHDFQYQGEVGPREMPDGKYYEVEAWHCSKCPSYAYREVRS